MHLSSDRFQMMDASFTSTTLQDKDKMVLEEQKKQQFVAPVASAQRTLESDPFAAAQPSNANKNPFAAAQ